MLKFVSATLGTALLATSIASFAENTNAILANVEGSVMVNQGEAYVIATESMSLNPGDRLMTMSGGTAAVEFANGCVQTLESNEVATLDNGEACAAGYDLVDQQVGSSSSGTGGSSGGGMSKVAEGAIFFGSAAVAIALADNAMDGSSSDRPPASP